MKKFTYILTLAFALLFGNTYAQSGLTGINYQAVARNNDGTVLAKQNVKVRISILGGTANGSVQYQETHDLTTNNLGLFTLQIGKGSPSTGTLTGVPWQNANQFLKVELAIGGGSFADLGTTQLMSVPFALYAANGNPGPIGPAGPIGPIGPTGVQGPTGATGPAGIQGPIGITGVAGPTGATGLTGPQGAVGLVGATGPQGTIGATGPVGPSGVQGSQGPVGATGPAGPIGPVGPAGALTGVAGGDLTGNYPNPNVKGIQNVAISAVAPVAGQVLKYNGTTWAPGTDAGGSLTLPYAATENLPGTLFSITNNGDGTSIEGVSNSTSSSIASLRGIVTSTAPGGFSSAVRGLNSGTGGLGIGVWGSQGGSGWGVYGVTPAGIGVYGNSSGVGYGLFGNSNTGIGLFATSTNGNAANISISNNSNVNDALTVSTLGNGTVVKVSTTGTGDGISSSSGTGMAVRATVSAQTSAAVFGTNTGGGESVVGIATSDIAGAVVGRNNGGGYGVRGFISTSTTGTGVGVQGEVGNNNSKGKAGNFINTNAGNIDVNTFEVSSNGNGNIPDNTLGNAASFKLDNTNSVGSAVRGEVNSIFGNFGAAGIFGVSSGTGGRAGLFYASNPAGNGAALVALTDGNGNAITANAGKNGNAVEANVDGTGDAVYGWVPSFGNGHAGHFENFNSSNDNIVLEASTIGNGAAGSFKVDNTNGTSPGVKGEVNSIFSNFGTAGVYGLSSGTGGFGGLFYSSNAAGNGPALIALTEGNGNGLTANAGKNGHGVEANCDGTGNAIYGWIPNFGGGKAARFANFNTANGNPTVHVTNAGTGNALLINHSGASGNIFLGQDNGANVARINLAGKGFFNGGTQASGADVAEAFDVQGEVKDFEPGDILVISTEKDRTVEKSAGPYSNLVAGVYATKPGLLLTEENIDSELIGKVPMGVIGVIPTKVCLEGGTIKRGDMLVTSSQNGVAMKADLNKVKVGQVLGKALQDFNEPTVAKINVLVSVK